MVMVATTTTTTASRVDADGSHDDKEEDNATGVRENLGSVDDFRGGILALSWEIWEGKSQEILFSSGLLGGDPFWMTVGSVFGWSLDFVGEGGSTLRTVNLKGTNIQRDGRKDVNSK